MGRITSKVDQGKSKFQPQLRNKKFLINNLDVNDAFIMDVLFDLV